MKEFKVGDMIEITEVGENSKRYFSVGDVGKIIEYGDKYHYHVDFNNQNKKNIRCHGIWWICATEQKDGPAYAQFKHYQEEKPRFHAAQVGDLLWNDERGICEVIKHFCNDPNFPTLGIKFSSGNGYECICLDGKSFINSPKATFFYYTTENHYLTERPEPEYAVDWYKVKKGTKIKSSNCDNDWEPGYFYKYDKKLALPFLVMNHSGLIDNRRFCELSEPCKPEWKK